MDLFFEILCSRAGIALNCLLTVLWCGCHAFIDEDRKVLRVLVLTAVAVVILTILTLQIWYRGKTL